MTKMKVSDYIANFFAEKGVTHSFGVTGGVITHLFDSIDRHPEIKLISPGNEQGASIMAEAYARITGMGLVHVTSGPGVTNSITGLACAYYDSIPLFFISGQSPKRMLASTLEKEYGIDVRQFGFQELRVPELVGSLTKYASLVTDVKDVKYELEKAYHFATTGRPGPVWLDICEDVQWKLDVDIDSLRSYTPENYEKIQYDSNLEEKINQTVRRIEQAERPVFIVGNGVRLARAYKETRNLIEKLKIPTALTWATKDMLPHDHPYVLEGFGVSSERTGNFAVANSDLLVVLGSRLDTHEAGPDIKSFAREADKIVIDLDKAELDKFGPLGLTGDNLYIHSPVEDFITLLSKKEIKTKDYSNWHNKINHWKKEFPICLEEYRNLEDFVDPYVFFDEFSKRLGEGETIITDAGANLIHTMQGMRMKEGQTLFSDFNHSTMGYSIPAAVGVAFATRKRVHCIEGDGAMPMNGQELGTARLHNLPINFFIFDNKGYGIIRKTQDAWLNGRHVATSAEGGVYLQDMEKQAYAFDIPYIKINDNKELNSKLDEILSVKDGPLIIKVNLRRDQEMIPKLLHGGRPIEDSSPLLSREQFLREMIAKPHPASLK